MARSLPRFNFITIGDSTVDVFLHIHEANILCQVNKEACSLCMNYGEKIPVQSVVKIPGAGNASNAAVGASRLGLKTSIVSIVGNDDIGKEIREHWKKESVDDVYVRTDPKRDTNYSTVLSFKGERTILVYSHPREYHLPDLDGTDWIYYTALGPNHEPLERQLLTHLKKNPRQKLAFNPGGNQLKRGLEALKPMIERSDLVVVNKEEAEKLLHDGVQLVPYLLTSLNHLGAKVAVITDGPNGSYATDGQQLWHCPIFPGPILERTGAGDSYATAFVCALYQDQPIPEAMRFGTANAWSVVQHIGPQKGLLTKTEMSSMLKKFKKIQAQKL